MATKAAEVRLDQARQAVEAKDAMGSAENRVAPIEAEIRVYTHDMVRANHDNKDHTLSFPFQTLKDCKLVVIRADYKGDMVMETVTGAMWQEGGWMLWTLIWRGHMVLLEPPPCDINVGFLLDRWQPHNTPALDFLFFWHSRYDQERTSPGTIFCRLCKP